MVFACFKFVCWLLLWEYILWSFVFWVFNVVDGNFFILFIPGSRASDELKLPLGVFVCARVCCCCCYFCDLFLITIMSIIFRFLNYWITLISGSFLKSTLYIASWCALWSSIFAFAFYRMSANNRIDVYFIWLLFTCSMFDLSIQPGRFRDFASQYSVHKGNGWLLGNV